MAEDGINELLEAYGDQSRDGESEEEIKKQISIIHNKVGIDLFEQQNFDQALERITIALNFNSTDIAIRKNRAACLLALKQFTLAETDLRFIIGVDPDDQESQSKLINIYREYSKNYIRNRQYIEAISIFDNVNWD
jgi:tetratricopeptide (TPR) repeat protein